MFNKLIYPVCGLIKRYRRNQLRRIMRAYLNLRRMKAVDIIQSIKHDLTEHHLNLSSMHFSPTIMGEEAALGETIVRQYLLTRVGGLELNRALLSAIGKKNGCVVFYLPKEWRVILMQHGFKVAHFRSSILWQLYVGAVLVYGMLEIGRGIMVGLFSRKEENLEQKRYSCFVGLGLGNLPQMIEGSQSYDVISWYLQWPGRTTGIEEVRHTVSGAQPVRIGKVDVLPARQVLPDLLRVRAVINYALWGLCAGAIATFDYLRGRWWHALLLNQAALAARARALPAEVMAQEYLFHNSAWIYRPLWTYVVERRGAAITFYFYSTNCESFKRPEGYPPISFGYRAMNWPRYLVWDDYQADFVRRAVGVQANISVVGPIWFQSNTAEIPRFDKPGVGVFDVTPHRASRYCTLGLDNEFYTPAVANPFLVHISCAIKRHGLLMLWKRKRNIGRTAHPFYRRLADQLAENGHVVLVDPDISAIRVIESSVAVVSMPFTSTALIAKAMGKPSIYYDPTGQLQRDDRAAHGIPILSGAHELEAWLSAQVPVQ